MTNASRIYLGNNVKQVVVTGGTGNITLGTVLQHASVADEIPIGKAFHYVYRAVNGSPLECGIGVMVDATTHRRDTVYARVNSNVYETGDNLAKINMPVGAFLHTAPTKQMLDDILNEMSLQAYKWGGTDSAITVRPNVKHLQVVVGANLTTLTLNQDYLPPAGTKHEFTMSVSSLDLAPNGRACRVAFAGAEFQFGNGIAIPDYPVINTKVVEEMPIGLVNGSTYTVGKTVRELISVVSDTGATLTRNTHYSFDEDTGVLTVLNVATFVQPWTITYKSTNESLFRFISVDGGVSYLVENITEQLVVNELPSITNDITLDIRHKVNKATLTGAIADVNILGVAPDVSEPLSPAYFEFKNTSSIEKRIIIDTDYFDVLHQQFPTVGFVLVQPGYTVAMEVSRNIDFASSKQYAIRNLQFHKFTRDLGVLTSPITLDIRHPWNIGELTGGATSVVIDGVSPDVPLSPMLEPAHFTIVNNGTVTKTVSWDTALFSIAGSVLSQVTLPIGYKVDFDVRRNPLNASVSYEVKVGDVNYNQTASGLATTWNPSDYATANLTLTGGNRTLEMTTGTGGVTNANGRSARAFGGKDSGKWLFGISVEAVTIAGSGTGGFFSIGVTDLIPSVVSMFAGLNASSGSFSLQRVGSSSGSTTWTYNKNVATSRAVIVPAVGDVIYIAFNASTGNGWVNHNGSWLYGGDPETGANPIFTLNAPNLFYPVISFAELSSGSAGRYTLLNELQAISVLSTVPSYSYWTA